MFSKALLSTAFISAVSAHQNLHQLWINNETPGYQTGIRMPPSNSPVEDVTSDNMACNVPSTNGVTVETLDANAGDSIKVQWDQSGHPGPITHFLKAVDSAATDNGVGAGWFKIDELNAVDGKWANEIMGANNMTHEFTLPTGLASGEYLLRSEMLALHGAQTLNGAQFYIGCAQLKVTGSGTGTCGPQISIPGAYKADDENIYIPNVYNGFDISTFKAPGGEVATCGGAAPAVPSTPQPANATVPAVPSPSASAVVEANTTPVASEAPVVSASAASAPAGSPVASSVPAPAPSSGAGADEALPTTFTLATFIAWLEGKAGSAAAKARRHARAF
ncbi:glycosyl hydrolase family 61-domain-containing protein [Ampelomyces quisqualis]|uniref:AA9 family lytic polysaccharide monooxygenase n=1 Tax=Ampelomyces quisqualis TaxID=50730 RepID=A0A6A5QQG4_AMPQU|nr:glycosyl hydrolase family 61-domain-containing protein [Ampelomyces quisqualis]